MKAEQFILRSHRDTVCGKNISKPGSTSKTNIYWIRQKFIFPEGNDCAAVAVQNRKKCKVKK